MDRRLQGALRSPSLRPCNVSLLGDLPFQRARSRALTPRVEGRSGSGETGRDRPVRVWRAEPAGSPPGGGAPSQALGGYALGPRPFVRPQTGTMLSTADRYAVKKRKKPTQVGVNRSSERFPRDAETREPGGTTPRGAGFPAHGGGFPPEGAKSNPSKRHRDRLNQELSKLTNLLPFPEDVRARLDKLSILRLSVGYLKVKSYFADNQPHLQNQLTQGHSGGPGPEHRATLRDSIEDCPADPPMNPGGSEHTSPQVNLQLFPEGDLLLQALNGFLMAVTEDGYVFYVSPTVQDYLGFHQSDVIYQSVFELIHKEDRAMFRSQFLWPADAAPVSREGEQDIHPLPGEKFLSLSGTSTDSLQHQPLDDPSYLERSFVCRFRCLLDNSSGFLELNFHGHLKFLPGQNNRSEDGILLSPQRTLFAIAAPCQPLTILELQDKTFLFQTKHKLDFTPIACDSRGKLVLGYTDSELCRTGSGYQFVHAADMTHCAENHVRLMRTGESGLTVFRLLTKEAGWLWVQSNARLLFRGGQPDCIVARQRALTNAEGEEHLRKRALQLPFIFTTGEAILYDSSPLSPVTAPPARKQIRARKGTPTGQGPVHPGSLLGAMMQQDESIYLSCIAPTPQGSLLERWRSNDSHECKEEQEEEEDHSLLALTETLLEKDTEEQPDLCSTLQHLGVTDLSQPSVEFVCKSWYAGCAETTRSSPGEEEGGPDGQLVRWEGTWQAMKVPPHTQMSERPQKARSHINGQQSSAMGPAGLNTAPQNIEPSSL
uniref:Aryl hydrocarbon receptor n=1 Tax=Callorhinus ursinus TaxID=34884 RepID=A0A3Q7NLK5_CALUR|nr:aryl hydrocarbon receptor-like [Callorhinus ursinus]